MKSAFIIDNRVRAVQNRDMSAIPGWVVLEPNEKVYNGMGYDANATPRFFPVRFPVPALKWTAFQFLLRFTDAERAAFRAAAATDESVADFMQLCTAASQVEADHPMTIAGMAYLVSEGLLTQARADEVLAK